MSSLNQDIKIKNSKQAYAIAQAWSAIEERCIELAVIAKFTTLHSWPEHIEFEDGCFVLHYEYRHCSSCDTEYQSVDIPLRAFDDPDAWLEELDTARIKALEAEQAKQRKIAEQKIADDRKLYEKLKTKFEND